ncbi:hypothetical protein CC80DRAFT_116182 [Byssothecium circinans]|uniref:Uncharacterized protein n=1 Tax=Byssothecium circinans TaxID=147558 RepID=A0A6A5TQU1_9PLEO|nr:hypothetical protein CC80DRAFT_116182 [Byssothecium circinans]
MAELAAIGTAANILQLVQFTTTVIGRLKEYQNLVDNVPHTLKQATAELPLLKLTLNKLREAVDKDSLALDMSEAVLPALKECDASIRSLHDTLEKIVPSPDDSMTQKHVRAMKSLRYDSKIEETIQRIREYIRALTFASLSMDAFKDTKLAKVRKWIGTLRGPDTSLYHRKSLERRHANTGQWFLEGDPFKTWKSEPDSMLWLHGTPGSGKSVLSSSIIDDIQHDVKS